MRRYRIVLILFLALAGCGTMAYQPTEYPLRDGLVQPFDIHGKLTVSNAQPDTNKQLIFSSVPTNFESNLNAVTQALIEQTDKELSKNGRPSNPGAEKSLAMKVTYFQCRESGFHTWRTNMNFEVALGDGQTLEFVVPHTSGIQIQSLDGGIAEGVMVLLNDERLKAYLAQ